MTAKTVVAMLLLMVTMMMTTTTMMMMMMLPRLLKMTLMSMGACVASIDQVVRTSRKASDRLWCLVQILACFKRRPTPAAAAAAHTNVITGTIIAANNRHA
jgi:hypothetical protein